MFRGRPPFRGYPPLPRPHPSPGYRDDRARPRLPYHQDYPEYRDHGAPDSYRRRYPSPGYGGHRAGDFWAGGSPPERSPSHRGPAHMDHSLVISVGNELSEAPGSVPPPHHHDRDYPARPEYERSGSRSRSTGRSHGRSKSRHRGQSHSPDQRRAKSRGRSKSRAKSRSPDRSRAKSRGRSKSRSPDRSRAKSRGRSKSRSPDRSRAKSRGRSKSRPGSKSKSRSRSRSLGKSRGRSRSRRHSSSSSSSSRSISYNRDKSDPKFGKDFKELEMARRRKEVEELLGQPTKSILKKHNSYEDSPSFQRSDSPGDLDRTMSRVADQLLQAVKLNDPHAVAAVLSELRSDPQMSQRANLNNEIKEILNLLGVSEPAGGVPQRVVDEIDDEEKFLYGELEEPKTLAAPEPVRHHSLDQYGDVTEDSLYSDPPSQRAVVSQVYSCPPTISPQLQAPPTVSEINTYTSRPSISADQNVTVQVPNPAYPPGTEPLEESERQALEEYEKIQDLLKTIGLDLGVGEISKMAARTKERLHGNKQPPKTPTRRRHYSSGSSDGSCHSRGHRRRSQSVSSSSSSRSRGRGTKRGGSWSSEDHEPKKSTSSKTPKHWEVKDSKSEWSTPTPPQTSDPSPIPTHTSLPIPTYPPPQLPGVMPPNYPPPGYGQYGNYLPYMHQQWPPMYPPPNMVLPHQTATDDPLPPPTYKKPYNKLTPQAGSKGVVRSICQEEQRRSQDQKVSDEQNNESEKLKVLEEREKLKQEREVRMTKKEYLIKELERLRKQQGELLRKKRREKDGHKDPLLQEINRLQEEVMAQISNLRKEHEAAEKKRSEIEKVALILGLSPSDRPSKVSKQPKNQDQEEWPPQKEKREQERSPEEQPATSSSAVKLTPMASSKASPEKVLSTASPLALTPDPFEYYDAGNHWCKNCNITSGSMFDFFTHLHSKTHRKTLDPYDRPWASSPTKISKTNTGEVKLTKPAKGSEFLVPVRGFFCLLCKEFFGDAICAEEHVITHTHNEKYKKQMLENPLYEQRRNLDRQAGLGLEASGKKRKHDDDKGSKDREEKTKNKKDKKDKKKEEESAENWDEKTKVKKEEEEHKVKPSRKSLEEDKSFHSKKDEDEKYKYSKKDEKCHYSREDEDRNNRYRNSSRDEEYRYCNRKDVDNRYDDYSKYGTKDTEDKYKHERCSDARSKCDMERDAGKPKAEREFDKRGMKPDVRKSEPSLKPYDLPKIFCGPSPAMRAKLRKQALEAGKAPLSASMGTSFGKFTWKKRENQLAKEAEEVAAEFIKEDEMAVKEQSGEDEDSFSKSMAAAKEIAEKLAGEQLKPPLWYQPGQGQIRPNLRAPVAQLRRPALAGKPASLNTFLNIRPQSTDGSLPGPSPRAPYSLPIPQISHSKPGPLVKTPGPLEQISAPGETKPEPFGPKLPPSMSKPEPCQAISALAGSKADSAESKPPASNAKQDPEFPTPATVESKPAPVKVKPSIVSQVSPVPLRTESSEMKYPLPQVKAATSQAPTAPVISSKATPSQPAMIKIVSDVAAPGVPESEQTRTVFVKPPPFKNMSEGPRKSEKPKSNLAAAKAKDLFDIFYSSIGQSGPSSFSKTELDIGAGKGSPSAPQALQIQTQSQPQPPNKPLSQPHTQPQPQDKPESQPHTQPQPQDKPESQPQIQPQPQPPNKPLSQPHTQPQPQDKPESQPQPQPPNKPLSQPHTQPQPQDKPESQPQIQPQPQPPNKPLSQPHTQPQPQDKLESQPQIQPQPQPPNKPISQPHTQPQPQDKPESQHKELAQTKNELSDKPQDQSKPQTMPQQQSPSLSHSQLPFTVQTSLQNHSSTSSGSPQAQTNADIQITSVWSLQATTAPTAKAVCPEISVPAFQSKQTPPAYTEGLPQSQPTTSEPETQIRPQTKQAPLEPTAEAPSKSPPQIQEETQAEPQIGQDANSHQEVTPEPQPKPKPSPRTRGKAAPMKKNPPAAAPVRQTRSQTRYQTRQQQQSEPELEQESAAGDRNTTLSETKGLESSDTVKETDPPGTEVTPETLGLHSEMTSLDYNFSFE
ncbi:zinc finger protein 318 isoform X3 [Girardinichthys multiradiatus]|uniref:zinc finger protein 318 isoform X3 n=1 Tax=Girardinichthys multiradiatus TaxID=208333 RepID=UPI001FAD5B0D|nr:zinc finger protein 318 isoform X3 [Girardinichthys multiradiatus]